ncbi:MAG TPA: hypothetical protein VK094_07655 [Pseudogracilibacillus sp.]|nr:hypothetical protein [Pseudogracilibacillus sp.]
MPLKLQLKLIISSLIVLLLVPILLYFFADTEVGNFLISFSSYFGAVVSLLGIYLLMMSYIKHREILAHEKNKIMQRGYFQIEKIKTSPTSDLTTQKVTKLLVTDNFKQYETEEPMYFYSVNLITEAKLILNLEISIEYADLSFTDRLYVARVEADTQILIPQRLSQTVEKKVNLVDLKLITLAYETLAGERMRLVFDEEYQKVSCYGEDVLSKEVKLYTEYLNEVELRSLN